MVESAAYNTWTVFVAMQTGNTIFLALGTASLPTNSNHLEWLRSLLSIVFFLLGSLITARVCNAVGPTRRSTLVGSFLIQSLFIVISAILVTTDAVPETDSESDFILIAIPFLALQFGAQLVTSRALGFPEIPTTVLTTAYSDCISDPNLLAGANGKRDRRLFAIALLFLGGVSGAWLSTLHGGFTLVLWLAAIIKVILGISCLFFPDESSSQAC